MDTQKISKILNLIEIAENNLKTAQLLIKQMYGSPQTEIYSNNSYGSGASSAADPESNFLEIVEGHFDGENMIGDDGKIYAIPANYASKTKLVVGDRMKRILTDTYREVYKVIQKAAARRVVGMFTMDETGEFVVIVDTIPAPVKVLKASITFAMKQQNLRSGDTVAILIPANGISTWGAFDSIVKQQGMDNGSYDHESGTVPVENSYKPRPSLTELKEQVVSNADDIPAMASMPNPFDSLDEFRM